LKIEYPEKGIGNGCYVLLEQVSLDAPFLHAAFIIEGRLCELVTTDDMKLASIQFRDRKIHPDNFRGLLSLNCQPHELMPILQRDLGEGCYGTQYSCLTHVAKVLKALIEEEVEDVSDVLSTINLLSVYTFIPLSLLPVGTFLDDLFGLNLRGNALEVRAAARGSGGEEPEYYEKPPPPVHNSWKALAHEHKKAGPCKELKDRSRTPDVNDKFNWLKEMTCADPPLTVVVCLSAVQKKFRATFLSIYVNLIKVNPACKFIIGLHNYSDVKTINNRLSSELGHDLPSIAEIKAIMEECGVEYYWSESIESGYDSSTSWIITLPDLYDTGHQSMRNIFRRANSWKMAFSAIPGDLRKSAAAFLFLRSCTYLVKPIIISDRPFSTFGGWNAWEGVNDRVFYFRKYVEAVRFVSEAEDHYIQKLKEFAAGNERWWNAEAICGSLINHIVSDPLQIDEFFGLVLRLRKTGPSDNGASWGIPNYNVLLNRCSRNIQNLPAVPLPRTAQECRDTLPIRSVMTPVLSFYEVYDAYKNLQGEKIKYPGKALQRIAAECNVTIPVELSHENLEWEAPGLSCLGIDPTRAPETTQKADEISIVDCLDEITAPDNRGLLNEAISKHAMTPDQVIRMFPEIFRGLIDDVEGLLKSNPDTKMLCLGCGRDRNWNGARLLPNDCETCGGEYIPPGTGFSLEDGISYSGVYSNVELYNHWSKIGLHAIVVSGGPVSPVSIDDNSPSKSENGYPLLISHQASGATGLVQRTNGRWSAITPRVGDSVQRLDSLGGSVTTASSEFSVLDLHRGALEWDAAPNLNLGPLWFPEISKETWNDTRARMDEISPDPSTNHLKTNPGTIIDPFLKYFHMTGRGREALQGRLQELRDFPENAGLREFVCSNPLSEICAYDFWDHASDIGYYKCATTADEESFIDAGAAHLRRYRIINPPGSDPRVDQNAVCGLLVVEILTGRFFLNSNIYQDTLDELLRDQLGIEYVPRLRFTKGNCLIYEQSEQESILAMNPPFICLSEGRFTGSLETGDLNWMGHHMVAIREDLLGSHPYLQSQNGKVNKHHRSIYIPSGHLFPTKWVTDRYLDLRLYGDPVTRAYLPSFDVGSAEYLSLSAKLVDVGVGGSKRGSHGLPAVSPFHNTWMESVQEFCEMIASTGSGVLSHIVYSIARFLVIFLSYIEYVITFVCSLLHLSLGQSLPIQRKNPKAARSPSARMFKERYMNVYRPRAEVTGSAITYAIDPDLPQEEYMKEYLKLLKSVRPPEDEELYFERSYRDVNQKLRETELGKRYRKMIDPDGKNTLVNNLLMMSPDRTKAQCDLYLGQGRKGDSELPFFNKVQDYLIKQSGRHLYALDLAYPTDLNKLRNPKYAAHGYENAISRVLTMKRLKIPEEVINRLEYSKLHRIKSRASLKQSSWQAGIDALVGEMIINRVLPPNVLYSFPKANPVKLSKFDDPKKGRDINPENEIAAQYAARLAGPSVKIDSISSIDFDGSLLGKRQNFISMYEALTPLLKFTRFVSIDTSAADANYSEDDLKLIARMTAEPYKHRSDYKNIKELLEALSLNVQNGYILPVNDSAVYRKERGGGTGHWACGLLVKWVPTSRILMSACAITGLGPEEVQERIKSVSFGDDMILAWDHTKIDGLEVIREVSKTFDDQLTVSAVQPSMVGLEFCHYKVLPGSALSYEKGLIHREGQYQKLSFIYDAQRILDRAATPMNRDNVKTLLAQSTGRAMNTCGSPEAYAILKRAYNGLLSYVQRKQPHRVAKLRKKYPFPSYIKVCKVYFAEAKVKIAKFLFSPTAWEVASEISHNMMLPFEKLSEALLLIGSGYALGVREGPDSLNMFSTKTAWIENHYYWCNGQPQSAAELRNLVDRGGLGSATCVSSFYSEGKELSYSRNDYRYGRESEVTQTAMVIYYILYFSQSLLINQLLRIPIFGATMRLFFWWLNTGWIFYDVTGIVAHIAYGRGSIALSNFFPKDRNKYQKMSAVYITSLINHRDMPILHINAIFRSLADALDSIANAFTNTGKAVFVSVPASADTLAGRIHEMNDVVEEVVKLSDPRGFLLLVYMETGKGKSTLFPMNLALFRAWPVLLIVPSREAASSLPDLYNQCGIMAPKRVSSASPNLSSTINVCTVGYANASKLLERLSRRYLVLIDEVHEDSAQMAALRMSVAPDLRVIGMTATKIAGLENMFSVSVKATVGSPDAVRPCNEMPCYNSRPEEIVVGIVEKEEYRSDRVLVLCPSIKRVESTCKALERYGVNHSPYTSCHPEVNTQVIVATDIARKGWNPKGGDIAHVVDTCLKLVLLKGRLTLTNITRAEALQAQGRAYRKSKRVGNYYMLNRVVDFREDSSPTLAQYLMTPQGFPKVKDRLSKLPENGLIIPLTGGKLSIDESALHIADDDLLVFAGWCIIACPTLEKLQGLGRSLNRHTDRRENPELPWPKGFYKTYQFLRVVKLLQAKPRICMSLNGRYVKMRRPCLVDNKVQDVSFSSNITVDILRPTEITSRTIACRDWERAGDQFLIRIGSGDFIVMVVQTIQDFIVDTYSRRATLTNAQDVQLVEFGATTFGQTYQATINTWKRDHGIHVTIVLDKSRTFYPTEISGSHFVEEVFTVKDAIVYQVIRPGNSFILLPSADPIEGPANVSFDPNYVPVAMPATLHRPLGPEQVEISGFEAATGEDCLTVYESIKNDEDGRINLIRKSGDTLIYGPNWFAGSPVAIVSRNHVSVICEPFEGFHPKERYTKGIDSGIIITSKPSVSRTLPLTILRSIAGVHTVQVSPWDVDRNRPIYWDICMPQELMKREVPIHLYNTGTHSVKVFMNKLLQSLYPDHQTSTYILCCGQVSNSEVEGVLVRGSNQGSKDARCILVEDGWLTEVMISQVPLREELNIPRPDVIKPAGRAMTQGTMLVSEIISEKALGSIALMSPEEMATGLSQWRASRNSISATDQVFKPFPTRRKPTPLWQANKEAKAHRKAEIFRQKRFEDL
jgi:hypothetical protein